MKQLTGMVVSLQSHVDDQGEDQVLPARVKSFEQLLNLFSQCFGSAQNLQLAIYDELKLKAILPGGRIEKALFLELIITTTLGLTGDSLLAKRTAPVS